LINQLISNNFCSKSERPRKLQNQLLVVVVDIFREL